ncbi:molybdopterin biosynthesis protein MoeY [Pseudoduganella sp. FT93W]|uniref:Molybdopterin biosynthesis protein MoeY n=1 Tax=Duganella fentianensis TaxID=2692177 RepID=A0A845HVJ3_9BURK|nr:nitroreductase family protein [Duganella fentianensis]MYN45049.1 molybdopterin biosynthesis protein MoeY [Duganella fentianensis]
MNRPGLLFDPTLEQILDLARWAPSGDNTQPWRFEILGPRRLIVHGYDTRNHCVYDLDGHPSQLSLGALLETMSIAATRFRLQLHASRHTEAPEQHPRFSIDLLPAPLLEADALADFIQTRSVQRRALSRRPLSPAERAALAGALPPGYQVYWLEGSARRQAAWLMFDNAGLRLTMPEAWQVHRSVIDWNARYSVARIPSQALGVDAATARLMQWIMQRWERVAFFNRWLAGTLAPRVQMDLLPGLACAAHFVLVAPHRAQRIDDFVEAGRAVQRFWLTAASLGLQLQPELTPLIFARYVRDGRIFSATAGMQERAAALSRRGAALLGAAAWDQAVFMGRIGAGPAARSRSLRLPLHQLLYDAPGSL